MNILMVCLGNICRSPLADGLLREKVRRANLPVYVDSAGTSAYHAGEAPDGRMQKTAKKNGYDITELRARQFVVGDFDAFDLIYVMDESNRDNVLKLSRSEEDQKKVKLILEEIPNFERNEVPDPYFGGQDGFDYVFEILDKASDIILGKIQNNTL